MTIEAFIVDYLNTEILSVPTSGDVPHPTPEKFITVEMTGARIQNYIPKADIVIESWAKTRAEAMALNEIVKGKMLEMVKEKEIMRCKLSSEYNYPLEATKHPRYQSIYEVVYDQNMTA